MPSPTSNTPPTKRWKGMKLVKVSDVPGFDKWLYGQTMPVVEGDPEPFNWAYWVDYETFISGRKNTD